MEDHVHIESLDTIFTHKRRDADSVAEHTCCSIYEESIHILLYVYSIIYTYNNSI